MKLIVEIIEPYHGKIYDPACGSGGMFVQSAHFVERPRKDPGSELSIYGQEKTRETVRLAKMNLAVHGLAGDIREANTYYEDLHDSVSNFDFVMANPPFNVNKVDKPNWRTTSGSCSASPSEPNADGHVNWLDTMLENALGHAGAHRVDICIDVIDGRDVCRLDVPASSRPIWAKIKQGDVLYERRNNSTRAIPEPEVRAFLPERFGSSFDPAPEELDGPTGSDRATAAQHWCLAAQ